MKYLYAYRLVLSVEEMISTMQGSGKIFQLQRCISKKEQGI